MLTQAMTSTVIAGLFGRALTLDLPRKANTL
jgi:hypothetical protein